MRTVYLGTSEFAVAVLERLARSEYPPTLIVTRPDRPRGRGRRLRPPPVAVAARELGIEVAQPEDVNDPRGRAVIAAARPEVVTMCAYGALLREPLLSAHEMLNVHPSLLPRWRGAAPIERAIEAGDAVTGVSIMRPTAEMDAGPVCLAGEEPIRPDDDYGSLAGRLAERGGELLIEALDRRPECVEQPRDGVTLAPKIASSERRLDPACASAPQLEHRVRALTPHVGVWLPLPARGPGGERLGVRRARVLPDEEARDLAAGARGLAPGELAGRGDRLLAGCAGGVLELLEVQPPGGRVMDAAAWLRGRGAALASRHAPSPEAE
jgi:methionyl-tRNA formyltransferase